MLFYETLNLIIEILIIYCYNSKYMDIASIVKFHRKQSGLSQQELAHIAGVGKTVVFDIEKGKKTVRLQTLLKVLSALNIRLNWESPIKSAFTHEREE